MRVVFFSYSDSKGGAAKAAYSIFISLKKNILNLRFLCVHKENHQSIKINNNLHTIYLFCLRIFEKIIIFFFKQSFHQSINIFRSFNLSKILSEDFDIINIHWVNRCALSLYEILKIKKKTVISLHDMWFLSGSSHYSYLKIKLNLLDNLLMMIKKKLYEKKNIFFIAHCKWMLNYALEINPNIKNKIFLCKYYPVDTNTFKPRNKKKLRKIYKIDLNARVILFLAQDINDPRKGGLFFHKIIKHFSVSKKFHFLILGGGVDKLNISKFTNVTLIPFLNHKQLANIYSLSDIYINTSTVDNLPLTCLEAMSSGLMVIAFDSGGIREVLKNNGYLVKVGDYFSIIKILKKINNSLIKTKSRESIKFAKKNFSAKAISVQYLKIFRKINAINIS